MIIEFKEDGLRRCFDASEVVSICEQKIGWDNSIGLIIRLRNDVEFTCTDLNMYAEIVAAMQTHFKLSK